MKHLDKIAHGVLVGGFALGVVAVIRVQSSGRELSVILLMAAFYLIWGLLYHHLKGDLSRKLLLEYLLIAAIAAATAFLVFRG